MAHLRYCSLLDSLIYCLITWSVNFVGENDDTLGIPCIPEYDYWLLGCSWSIYSRNRCHIIGTLVHFWAFFRSVIFSASIKCSLTARWLPAASSCCSGINWDQADTEISPRCYKQKLLNAISWDDLPRQILTCHWLKQPKSDPSCPSCGCFTATGSWARPTCALQMCKFDSGGLKDGWQLPIGQ